MEHTLAIAAQIASRRSADLARLALPDAPTSPEPDGGRPSPDRAAASLRHLASLFLRRVADRLDMQSGHPSVPGSPC